MFLPIGDDNSQRRVFPFITYLILGINIWVWFLELRFGDDFIYAYSSIAREITSNIDLIGSFKIDTPIGAQYIEHTPGPSPIQLTLLSSMFMHGSWMHIIGNMLYLLIFADQIEDRFGHIKFLIFYLVVGLAGSVAHIVADPNSVIPSLGASGAIAGVLGSYLVLFPHNRVKVFIYNRVSYLPAYIVLALWGVMQVVGQLQDINGQSSGVAYMAHIGGFVAGIILTPILKGRSR